MNHDLKTTEYVAKLKDMKLSEQSKSRIKNNLQEYAAFHNVRNTEVDRSIGVAQNPSLLFRLKFAYMPLIILLAVMIGGGTTLAAQASVPGDFLYPVKIGVNENIREALAVSTDSEANLQADLLEERLEEAKKLQAKGRLTAETGVVVATNISTQAKVAAAASKLSSADISTETKARIQVALQSFLSSTNLDSTLATEISTSLFATELATGLYDINAYRADMKARTEALVKIMNRYEAKLQADVYADLSVKLVTAIKLTAEAQTQIEADARVTLDKAATLTGEVESKLSTLGQVEIDSDTGIITDIDFSIDPMIIDRGEGNSDDSTGASSTSGSAGSGVSGGVNIDTSIDGSLDSDIINSTTSVGGGASVGL